MTFISLHDPSKYIFQHDNDPKHRAKSIQDWIANQHFEVLEWPPQSPDLNPIEHIWCHLKRRLNSYDSAPKGILALWERVETEWNKIGSDLCVYLIESMHRRVEAVLRAKGGWTKY